VSAHLKPAREYIAIGNKDTWLIFVGTIVPISFAGLKKKKNMLVTLLLHCW